jgi:hypothetical protein
VSEGLYCAVNEDNSIMRGRDIILENLRERCIFNMYLKEDQSIYYKYINATLEMCYNFIDESCSKEIHLNLNLDY